jgi:hypothetical protein
MTVDGHPAWIWSASTGTAGTESGRIRTTLDLPLQGHVAEAAERALKDGFPDARDWS